MLLFSQSSSNCIPSQSLLVRQSLPFLPPVLFHPPLYQSCQSSTLASFLTVHLHITSAAQFWRMKRSYKGRWLIRPRWDRDASLLHKYYRVELERLWNIPVQSHQSKVCILIDTQCGKVKISRIVSRYPNAFDFDFWPLRNKTLTRMQFGPNKL